jgi:alpha-glucosidase
MARRRGQAWFIGVLNGASAGDYKIDLSFLGAGNFKAEIFGDDPANPAAFRRETRTVSAKDSLTASLSVRGGYAVWIQKAP